MADRVASARRAIDDAIREFGQSLVVLTSFQREGVIIVDLVLGAAPETPVITIDTGRLPEATHRMIAEIESRYAIQVEKIGPDPAEVESMTAMYGHDLFRYSVPYRTLCCNIRKVRSLDRRMRDVAAYFAGLRRGQSESRVHVEIFDRSASPAKVSPLADWSPEDVARYTSERDLPEHPLYSRGYTSIGCDPCTRATAPGEPERAGRWWWEEDTQKECGLHFSPDGRVERTVDVLLRDVLKNTRAAA